MIWTAADLKSHFRLPLPTYFAAANVYSCLFAIDKLLLGNCMKRQFCPAVKINHLKPAPRDATSTANIFWSILSEYNHPIGCFNLYELWMFFNGPAGLLGETSAVVQQRRGLQTYPGAAGHADGGSFRTCWICRHHSQRDSYVTTTEHWSRVLLGCEMTQLKVKGK